jgi:hypothetical protein
VCVSSATNHFHCYETLRALNHGQHNLYSDHVHRCLYHCRIVWIPVSTNAAHCVQPCPLRPLCVDHRSSDSVSCPYCSCCQSSVGKSLPSYGPVFLLDHILDHYCMGSMVSDFSQEERKIQTDFAVVCSNQCHILS